MPSTTSPKTRVPVVEVRGGGRSVMKNWLPLVFGPALAIESMPALVVAQRRVELVARTCSPGRRVPVPVGSPPWTMKPPMTRWKIVPS